MNKKFSEKELILLMWNLIEIGALLESNGK
jgi:hypothetical protein